MKPYISALTVCALSFFVGLASMAASAGDAELAQLLVGKWKVVATDCDKDGNNCFEIKETMVIEFTADGEFKAQGLEGKTNYKVEGGKFILSGNDKSVVKIIQLDAQVLRTQEDGKEKTEKFTREK